MFRRMKMGAGYQILEETEEPGEEKAGLLKLMWNSLTDNVPGKKRDGEKLTQQQSNAELSNPINQEPRIQTTSKTGFDTLKDYQLTVMIRNKMVNMKISSENFKSYINRDTWYELGEPKLQHSDDVLFKGYFIANIHYGGRVFQLPLMVSKRKNGRNIIGRSWFPALHLNWNGIFYCIKDADTFQLESDKQRQLAIEMADKFAEYFNVNVNVEGIGIQMKLFTAHRVSKITLADWEKLGKPALQRTNKLIDWNGEQVNVEGECKLQVEYNGQSGVLPLVVLSEGCHSMIGTNWFKWIQFDFNTIFSDIQLVAK